MSKVQKTKFSSSDVKAMVEDVKRAAIGKRVANIYDISEKTYLLKFAAPGVSEKSLVLIESGVRFHCTKYTRSVQDLPSAFAMKLRKHLRTKRLDNIQQLGFDRVVDMKFSSGEYVNHLVLEFYSGGNIVLTDANYEVIALFRSHQFDADVTLKVGEIYPIAFSTNIAKENNLWTDSTEFIDWIKKYQKDVLIANSLNQENPKAKKPKPATLRQMFLSKDSPLSVFGPEIIDHIILSSELKPSMKIDQLLSSDISSIETLISNFQLVDDILKSLETQTQGKIFYEENANHSKFYEEFSPLNLKQHIGKPFIEFPSFTEAVDDYFYNIEDQKIQKEKFQREEAAKKKISRIQEEHEKVISTLAQHQQNMLDSAMLVEMHADEVDKVCLVINSCLGAEMSWDAIEEMVELQKAQGNPIASLISSLKLSENKVILAFPKNEIHDIMNNDLDEFNFEELEEESKMAQKSELVEVEIDLDLSAFANARRMYGDKKVAYTKELKTLQASTKALQSVKDQTLKTLETQNTNLSIKAVRKVHWFEKFNWFFTSEGFLVLSGKDAQQNELLFKKYLRPHDIYIHADVAGASTCILRAKVFATESDSLNKANAIVQNDERYWVTPLAIQEAGVMAVCRSRAWDAKFISSAYWVKASQVSKTAPSGEYLTTGSFMIYGKKNYLPPMPLEMGFGILFRLHDDCIAAHAKDRKLRSYDLDSHMSFQDNFDRYSVSNPESTQNPDVIEEENEEEVEEENRDDEKSIIEQQNDSLNPPPDNNNSENISKEEIQTDNQETEDNVCEDIEDINLDEEEEEDYSSTNLNNLSSKNSNVTNESKSKKKNLNKKKQRRYAEQDDEDRELAMISLGHASKTGETLKDKLKSQNIKKKSEEIKVKQAKAGIKLLQSDWSKLLGFLLPEVSSLLNQYIEEGWLKEGDIEEPEIKELSLFSVENALTVLTLFREGKSNQKVNNKSAFLAGIIRRVRRESENNNLIKTTQTEKVNSKTENLEIKEILEDEGLGEPNEIENAEDVDKLTANPFLTDNLLYAVPFCGPYMSMQNFKYKIKLTPGTLKKGKAAKQSIDLFTKLKECSNTEKALIRALTDNEVVAVMVGEVKLSMPGLQSLQQKNKKQRGQK